MLHRAPILALVLGLSACGPPGDRDAGLVDRQHMPGPRTGAACPTTDPPTYEGFGRAFMETYCTRCHAVSVTGAARAGAPARYDFDTIDGIRARVESIERSTAAGPEAVNTWMPEIGAMPTLDERERLGEWLACGAP